MLRRACSLRWLAVCAAVALTLAQAASVPERVVQLLADTEHDAAQTMGWLASLPDGKDRLHLALDPSTPPDLAVGMLTLDTPASVQQELYSRLKRVIDLDIRDRNLPGCVIGVVQRGRIMFKAAYGHRAVQPSSEDMTLDTIFDMASLTKVIATTTSVMQLVEQGMISLHDPVARYIPAWGRNGKDDITVRQLMEHRSGLLPDNSILDYQGVDHEEMWQRVFAVTPRHDPGSLFLYSDLNYETLGKVVESVSGLPLDRYFAEHVAQPLGLHDTQFRPPTSKQSRIAPQDKRGGSWIRGQVQDPRSFALGGVAGHAGLFSTLDDVLRFVTRVLIAKDRSVLSPAAVRAMTTPHGDATGVRGLGWDIDSHFSSNRGDLLHGDGASFGHTGWTGTSVWVSPVDDLAIVFLSNRLHPYGSSSSVVSLRGRVANVIASALLSK